MVLDLDPDIFNVEIEELGSIVTVVNISSQEYNDRGDLIDGSESSYETKAVIDNLGGVSTFQNEGRYRPDDKIFVLPGESPVSIGDYILHKSQKYEVEAILDGELGDISFVKQITTKKI